MSCAETKKLVIARLHGAQVTLENCFLMSLSIDGGCENIVIKIGLNYTSRVKTIFIKQSYNVKECISLVGGQTYLK